MKKITVLIALALVSFTSQAQSKIGTINVDYILTLMPEIEGVQKGLEAYNAELEKDRDSTITKYNAAIKEYQEKGEGMTEEERKVQENAIISLENDLQSFRQKASVMLQMKQSELTKPLYEKIDAALQKVVTTEGFTQIFTLSSNALAYSREEDDVTLKVLAELGIEVKEE